MTEPDMLQLKLARRNELSKICAFVGCFDQRVNDSHLYCQLHQMLSKPDSELDSIDETAEVVNVSQPAALDTGAPIVSVSPASDNTPAGRWARVRKISLVSTCLVNNCGNPVYASEYCQSHYDEIFTKTPQVVQRRLTAEASRMTRASTVSSRKARQIKSEELPPILQGNEGDLPASIVSARVVVEHEGPERKVSGAESISASASGSRRGSERRNSGGLERRLSSRKSSIPSTGPAGVGAGAAAAAAAERNVSQDHSGSGSGDGAGGAAAGHELDRKSSMESSDGRDHNNNNSSSSNNNHHHHHNKSGGGEAGAAGGKVWESDFPQSIKDEVKQRTASPGPSSRALSGGAGAGAGVNGHGRNASVGPSSHASAGAGAGGSHGVHGSEGEGGNESIGTGNPAMTTRVLRREPQQQQAKLGLGSHQKQDSINRARSPQKPASSSSSSSSSPSSSPSLGTHSLSQTQTQSKEKSSLPAVVVAAAKRPSAIIDNAAGKRSSAIIIDGPSGGGANKTNNSNNNNDSQHHKSASSGGSSRASQRSVELAVVAVTKMMETRRKSHLVSGGGEGGSGVGLVPGGGGGGGEEVFEFDADSDDPKQQLAFVMSILEQDFRKDNAGKICKAYDKLYELLPGGTVVVVGSGLFDNLIRRVGAHIKAANDQLLAHCLPALKGLCEVYKEGMDKYLQTILPLLLRALISHPQYFYVLETMIASVSRVRVLRTLLAELKPSQPPAVRGEAGRGLVVAVDLLGPSALHPLCLSDIVDSVCPLIVDPSAELKEQANLIIYALAKAAGDRKELVKQLHTEVGRQLALYKGPLTAAMKKGFAMAKKQADDEKAALNAVLGRQHNETLESLQQYVGRAPNKDPSAEDSTHGDSTVHADSHGGGGAAEEGSVHAQES